jgi:hypothetical protein
MVGRSGSRTPILSYFEDIWRKLLSEKIRQRISIKKKTSLIFHRVSSWNEWSTMDLESKDREAEIPKLIASHNTNSSSRWRKHQRWESHRKEICELYMVENNTLKRTMQIIGASRYSWFLILSVFDSVLTPYSGIVCFLKLKIRLSISNRILSHSMVS